MKATKRQKLIGLMLRLGREEAPSRSSKYVGFLRRGEPERTLWFGSAGAMRVGVTPTKSFPTADSWKAIYLKEAERYWARIPVYTQMQIIANYPSPKRRSYQ